MIPNWLLQRAYLSPDKTAFTFKNERWTFSELKDKAKEYDNLKAFAIEKALKNGIKAKGERFNKEVNEKLLKGLSLAEIEAIAGEWEEDAKMALNAGKRVSEYTNNKEVTKIANIEDFKF